MGYGADGNEEVFKSVAGKKIKAVDHTDSSCVDIRFVDGGGLRLALEGDCCSSSDFTDLKQFNELIGATIATVEERSGAAEDDARAEQHEARMRANDQGDVLSWHFLVFTTDHGHVTVDWHNDSNGYYDGSLTASVIE